MSEPSIDLGQYFKRIGYQGDAAPTLTTLRELHRLHAQAIPFENIASLAGQPVALDLVSVQNKLVLSRRGGYCFEHNSLLWWVLTQLGFDVSGLAARVLWGVPGGKRTPRGHMLLKISLAEGDYLADVGFGGLTFTGPLAFVAGRETGTPHEALRVQPLGGEPWGEQSGEQVREYQIEARLAEGWQPLYAFDLQAQYATDYVPRNWYTCTHPESVFVTTLRLGRPVTGGRHALLNNRYTRYTMDGEPEVRFITDLDELTSLIDGAFGIELPALPGLEQKLRSLLAVPAADKA